MRISDGLRDCMPGSFSIPDDENDNGIKVVNFCAERNLCVAITRTFTKYTSNWWNKRGWMHYCDWFNYGEEGCAKKCVCDVKAIHESLRPLWFLCRVGKHYLGIRKKNWEKLQCRWTTWEECLKCEIEIYAVWRKVWMNSLARMFWESLGMLEKWMKSGWWRVYESECSGRKG